MVLRSQGCPGAGHPRQRQALVPDGVFCCRHAVGHAAPCSRQSVGRNPLMPMYRGAMAVCSCDLVLEAGLQSNGLPALVPVLEGMLKGAGGKITDWRGAASPLRFRRPGARSRQCHIAWSGAGTVVWRTLNEQ